jgi:phosphoribulokinase
MSKKHPIIAVTGSSGAGRGAVKEVFDKALNQEHITAAYVSGESFHRFTRTEMQARNEEAIAAGNYNFSHFSPDANLFDDQEELYRSYGENGTGKRRHYLHNGDEAARHGFPDLKAGEFTPWENLPEGTDMLFYEGLHGVVKWGDGRDLSPHVDLKIGVAPVINLEWIRKVRRDTGERGYSTEAVVDSILNRMHDYVHYIIPQFQHSDINFQQVPVVDSSDPLIAREIPSPDECVAVIRFRDPAESRVDFGTLLNRIPNSWMSRRNSIVVPGGKMFEAMEVLMSPLLHRLMECRR